MDFSKRSNKRADRFGKVGSNLGAKLAALAIGPRRDNRLRGEIALTRLADMVAARMEGDGPATLYAEGH